MSQETPWQNIPDDLVIEDFAGFVYSIENLETKRCYIGRKYFWSTTSKKIEGKKRRKKTTKESNWKSYKSSCTELKDDITSLGIDKFKFQILSLHETKGQVNYEETRQQFIVDVLYSKLDNGEYEYYNKNILHRYYRREPTK